MLDTNEAALLADQPPRPEGFEILPACEHGFLRLVGPFYVRTPKGTPIGMPVIGLHVRGDHLNYSGGAHGGMLATIADMQGAAVRAFAQMGDVATPTISLAVEFIAPAPDGTWLELHSFLTGKTRTLLFSRAELRIGDKVIANANAIYKIGKLRKIDVELLPLSVTGY